MCQLAYLPMYRLMHPGQHGSLDLQFRLRLLRFTLMFRKRSQPSEVKPSPLTLHAMRSKRQDDSARFRCRHTGFARLDVPDLTQCPDSLDIAGTEHEQGGENGKLHPPSASHGTVQGQSSLSLIDIIPQFMALSAAQNAMQETTITEIWMHLAAGFMAHAVIEQYLKHGVSDPALLLQEAFAWGFDADCSAEEGSDEWQINAMFWGDDGAVIGWDRIRDEHLHIVCHWNCLGLAVADWMLSACTSTRTRDTRAFSEADRTRSVMYTV